jgi:hypothetical protein
MRRRGRGGQRPAVAVAVVLAGLAFLAGCGSTPYRPAAASRPAGQRPPSTTGVPVAGTRAEAEAEARRLLAELVLPAGARRLPGRPVPGAVSAPGQSLGNGLDLYRFFRLPVSMDAVQQFLQAHLPPGLAFSSSGSGGGPGSMPEYDVLAADVPPRAMPPGIDIAELVYTIAPDASGGSVLRADAQIIIFPARSAAEYLDPADIRSVTVSTTGPDPLSRTVTSRPEIARLARMLDGQHAFPPGLVYSCPAELGPMYQLTFTPVSARWPTVVVDPNNCMGSAVFANGVRQPSLTGTELYSVAQRLLPAPQRALPGMTKNSGGTASAPG